MLHYLPLTAKNKKKNGFRTRFFLLLSYGCIYSEQHPARVVIRAQVLAQGIRQIAAIIRTNDDILTTAVRLHQKAEQSLRVIQNVAGDFFGIFHAGFILPFRRRAGKCLLRKCTKKTPCGQKEPQGVFFSCRKVLISCRAG